MYLALGFAPDEISNSTTCTWLLMTASWSGTLFSNPGVLTETPLSSSILTTSICPKLQASCWRHKRQKKLSSKYIIKYTPCLFSAYRCNVHNSYTSSAFMPHINSPYSAPRNKSVIKLTLTSGVHPALSLAWQSAPCSTNATTAAASP